MCPRTETFSEFNFVLDPGLKNFSTEKKFSDKNFWNLVLVLQIFFKNASAQRCHVAMFEELFSASF